MDKRGYMMMRVFINRFNPKTGDGLLKFCSKEEARSIADFKLQTADLGPLLQSPQIAIGHIHYSWIQEALKQISTILQPMVIGSLTQEQIAGLKVPSPLQVLPIAKSYFLEPLYRLLEIGDHFPPQYLTPTELTPLAYWKKDQLMNLCDFLGLNDLAAEVRAIVNRNYLKNIYTCLTPKQLHYLKYCLQQQEKLTSPKIGIDFSKQDCAKLNQAIHRRGLARFGKALCGQHADLVWHIAHIFDINRGNLLIKEYRPQEVPKVTKLLRQQLLNLINFLEKS